MSNQAKRQQSSQMGRKYKWFRRLARVMAVLLVLFAAMAFLFAWWVLPPTPKVQDTPLSSAKRTETGANSYVFGSNSLRRSSSGLWELYVEGSPYEMGLANGALTQELAHKQESAFVAQIRQIVPSDFYLQFLKYFVAWFNKDIYKNVAPEFLEEIYGASRYSSPDFDYIGPAFVRVLNYHAAHDIGHALQDKRMVVGCTSFSAQGSLTDDGELLVGRNFDFYVGDEFGKEKVVAFCRPQKGHPFMMVSWAGMVGAVSGMNLTGLTVTLNAAKSEVPTSGSAPISLIAREILQYASTIDEAFQIARKRKAFVSESILIASAIDGMSAIIEKSTDTTALYQSKSNLTVCANHFQSLAFASDPLNVSNIERSSSMSRFNRVGQLIQQDLPLDAGKAAGVLRDRKGPEGQDIGMGNEKGINQLLAHHSVIFKPKKQICYVSTGPYNLGRYVAYDLNKVFSSYPTKAPAEMQIEAMAIPADTFLTTPAYASYELYRTYHTAILAAMKARPVAIVAPAVLDAYVKSNPKFYLVYSTLGEYNAAQGEHKKAVLYYQKALELEVYSLDETDRIKALLATSLDKSNG